MDEIPMLTRIENVVDYSCRFFTRQLKPSGQIGDLNDLCEYCKIPNVLIYGGYIREANMVIDWIVNNYFQANGDFETRPGYKTRKDSFIENYVYCNEWIIQAAIRIGRFDFIQKATAFIYKYYNPKTNACLVKKAYNDGDASLNENCIFNTAAMGLTTLYLGDIDKAIKLGDTLVERIESQPAKLKKDSIFYLRFKDNGEYIREYADKSDPAECPTMNLLRIDSGRVKQSWWAMGYPAAYLAILYRYSKNKKYLDVSERLIQFAAICNDDIRNNSFAHKIMWASALLGELTNKKIYWDLCFDLVRTILNQYDLTTGKPHPDINQVAEIPFWLQIVAMNVKSAQRKFKSKL